MKRASPQHHARLARRAAAIALAGAALAAPFAGCEDLARLDPDVCGNRVVEDEAGEDCDGQEGCGSPSTQHACLWLCGEEQNHKCPDGYGCGVDEVCRRAKGAFEPLLTKSSTTAVDLLVGDTNADGCSEIVRTTFNSTVVTTLDSRQPGLCLATEQSFASFGGGMPGTATPPPFIGDLDSNARPELVVTGSGPITSGMRVYSSDASRTLASLVFTSEEIPEANGRLLRVHVGTRVESLPGVVDTTRKDRLLVFLGDAYEPLEDPPPACAAMDGGVPMPDGGMMMPPDGGMMMPPDGGMMMPPDGGMMMPPDGGLPPPDGGMMMPPDGGMMMPPDGGLPPADGGLPPADAGLPPADGGLPPPDGGLPPPDGGLPPPPDGGPPPPPGRTPRAAGTVRVAGLDLPGALTRTLAELDGGLDSIVAIAAGDLDKDGCDEVAIGRFHDPVIRLYQVCSGDDNLHPEDNHKFVFRPWPGHETLTLDDGAAMRGHNASIAFGDVDGDGWVDVVTNGDDCNAHIAWGGPSGLNSMHGLTPNPDHRTSIFTELNPDTAIAVRQPDSVLVVGKFDDAVPGAQVIAPACPQSDKYASDVCLPLPGECEAIVADIDKDGRDDIVATQGQQPGLFVGRSRDTAKGFHISTIETDCPPHQLVAGDFDDDGVTDVAFIDQAAIAGGTPRRVLKIARGRADASPEAPHVAAVVDGVIGVAAGAFANGSALLPIEQIFTMRAFGPMDAPSTGLALLGGNVSGEMLAPVYLPRQVPSPSGLDVLASFEILAATSGRFGLTAAQKPAAGLAAFARLAGQAPELWRLYIDESTGKTKADSVAAGKDLSCASCAFAAVDTDGDGADELAVFDGGLLVLYGAGPSGFTERGRATIDHPISSLDATSNPARYAPRPLVADLDHDGHADVLVRSAAGELVAFWGRGDGTFEEKNLLDPPACAADHCAGLSFAQIRLDDSTDKKLVVLGPGELSFHAIADRALAKVTVDLSFAPPALSTDFVAVAAGDLDGDGVDDLALMTSGSTLHVLRGIPVHE